MGRCSPWQSQNPRPLASRPGGLGTRRRRSPPSLVKVRMASDAVSNPDSRGTLGTTQSSPHGRCLDPESKPHGTRASPSPLVPADGKSRLEPVGSVHDRVSAVRSLINRGDFGIIIILWRCSPSSPTIVPVAAKPPSPRKPGQTCSPRVMSTDRAKPL